MTATLPFEQDESPDPVTKQYIDIKLKELAETAHPRRFAVVLHNDPVNNVDFVVRVIKKVFGYGTAKAIRLMLAAHFSGKSILWTGPQQEAIAKQQQVIAFGPDPNGKKRGARPLTVTVELQA
jgi:ATP-dependent Clp protease adaptor protein ClpS